MNEQERIIREYFQMWISRDFTSIDKIFDKDIFYRECYGACYSNLREIHLWLNKQLDRQKVLSWTIDNIYSVNNDYFVTWTFKAKEGKEYIFDGISKITFDIPSNKIIEISEFETKHDIYYPFKDNKKL